MQSYRVMVHGENLLTEVEGTRQRLGFYTHVVVEAFTVSQPIGSHRLESRMPEIGLSGLGGRGSGLRSSYPHSVAGMG
jgi:hypothetical protein